MSKAGEPLDAIVLLQKTLAKCGVEASPWALAAACRRELSLSAFARCAREQGLEATVLKLRDGDTEFLSIGAIVTLNDGAFATVLSHGPSGARVEDATGKKFVLTRKGGREPKAALEIRATPSAKTFLRRLRMRVRAEPHFTRAIVLCVVFSVVLAVLAIAAPVVTHAALGSALPDRAVHTLDVIAIGIVVLGVQSAYVAWLRRRALLYLTSKLSENAALDVVSHIIKLPFARLRATDLSVVQQAAGSAARAAESIPVLAPQFLDAILGVGFLGYAILVDPKSGAIVGLAGLAVFLLGVVYGRGRVERNRELLTKTRQEQQGLYESFVGIETVKAESVEGRMLARWLDRLLAEEKVALTLRIQQSTFSTLLSAFERIVFATMLLVMAKRCLSAGASIADLVAVVQASAGFMGSAQRLALLPSALSDYRSNTERADDALQGTIDKDDGHRTPAESGAPAIVLRDVWFRYEDDSPWVLAGLDLRVKHGETVILSWPSGAGKSTLLRVLSGLLAPTRGDAMIFGVEATNARRMITYVPQHATLFSVSVMENIRILSGGASRERIMEMAEATGLLAIVSKWGMGMDTIVSLGVANVSSGQKQLILFTAAAASETPLVLLDEALAHVDLGVRARLGAANIFRNRTVVAVVHDASAREVAHARVVPMEHLALKS